MSEPIKTDPEAPYMDFTIAITHEQLTNILTDAGIGYWGHFDSHKAVEQFVHENKPLTVTDDEEKVKHIVTQLDLKRAVRIIAVNYPHHLSSLFGDYDAETGDVLVQCMALGEIVYG